jgi:hypothetical protein
MTAAGTGRRMRVPPTVMRLGMRQIGTRCLNPALPWQVQRTRLERFLKTSRLPRGTTVSKRTVGGVHAEVVAAPEAAKHPGESSRVVDGAS